MGPHHGQTRQAADVPHRSVFTERGYMTVFLVRLLTPVRAFPPVTAGALGMPPGRLFPFNLAAAGGWNVACNGLIIDGCPASPFGCIVAHLPAQTSAVDLHVNNSQFDCRGAP